MPSVWVFVPMTGGEKPPGLWARFKYEIEPALPFIRENYLTIIAGGVLIILAAGLQIPGPLFTRYMIDHVIPQRDVKMLLVMIGAVLGILGFTITVEYVVTLVFAKVKNNLIVHLALTLLRRIHGIEHGERQKLPTGYLMSRIEDDVNGLEGLFVDTVTHLVSNVASLVFAAVTMLILEWRLACCVFVLLPPFLYFTVHYSRRITQTTEIYAEKRALALSRLEETISLSTLSALFTRSEHNVRRYRERALESVYAALDVARYAARYSASTDAIFGIMPVTIMSLGIAIMFYQDFTIGSLIAFISFSSNLFAPARELVHMNTGIRQALVSLKRINQIYRLPAQKDGDLDLNGIERISFRGVRFSYPDDQEQRVLDGLELEIPRGARVGLVGGSGSGKTTIAKLLLRLYDPVEGRLEINDLDVRDFKIDSVRAKIGYVEQEPRLFDDTIFENIIFGLTETERNALSEEALRARVDAVVKLARIDFLDRLSDGLFTPVSQAGGSLSVGQKQRIAIARALIRQPDVLIFDEATANLDSISETAILHTIGDLPKSVTVFIISHRLSFIRTCDPVLVMEAGRLVERGAFATLVADAGGHFRRYADQYQL